jgi:phosphatidylglycerophosphate synthase
MRAILRLTKWLLSECLTAFDAFRIELARLLPHWITANHLTFARLYCMGFSTLALIFYSENRTWLLTLNVFILIVAAISDFLDGPRARLQNNVTVFGSLLDAAVDKFLVIFNLAFIAKWVSGMELWFWIFVALETLHGTAGLLTNRKISLSAPLESNWPGKLKMVAVLSAMGFGFAAMLQGDPSHGSYSTIARWSLVATVPLAVLSMGMHIERQRRAKLAALKDSTTPVPST